MASPTPQDLTTQLQKAQDALNAKTGKKTQLPSITPTSSPVITSDTLKPQDKFSFPDTTPSTAVVGDLARIQSQTDDYTSNLKTASDTAKATETTSFQDYLNTKLNAPTREQLESTNYAKKGGVDDVQVELDNINSQIRAEQRALDVQLREIDKQAGGLQSGAQSEKSNLQRDSLQKQADLSVIQMAIQGRYDSARNIADRSINARISQDQKEIDISREMYNRNASLFTLAESRAFESAQADRQRALDKEALDLKTLSDTKLEAMKMAQMNGAPSSVLQAIQSATSPEQVISAGGQYAVTDMLDRQLKQAQLRAANQTTTTKPTLQNFGTSDNPNWKQYNSTTGGWGDVSGIDSTPTSNALGNAIAKSKVDNINNILNSNALGSVVGPSSLARTQPGLWGAAKRFFSGALSGGTVGAGVGAVAGGFGAIPGAIIGALTTGVVNTLRGAPSELTGARQSFVGSVEQMRAELTKEKLAQAKGQGVTFGALSDGERGLIANAATKLGTWAVHVDGDKDKPVIGYNIDEKSFKKEMDVINYFTKLDAVIKGATPESVGAVTQPDGTVWIMNSDGTMSELKRQ